MWYRIFCATGSSQRKEQWGQPVKVFTPAGLAELLSASASAGFEQTGLLDVDCGEAAVHWLDLDYTFVVFTLRHASKTAVGSAPGLRAKRSG
jgi:hypothetical protein